MSKQLTAIRPPVTGIPPTGAGIRGNRRSTFPQLLPIEIVRLRKVITSSSAFNPGSTPDQSAINDPGAPRPTARKRVPARPRTHSRSPAPARDARLRRAHAGPPEAAPGYRSRRTGGHRPRAAQLQGFSRQENTSWRPATAVPGCSRPGTSAGRHGPVVRGRAGPGPRPDRAAPWLPPHADPAHHGPYAECAGRRCAGPIVGARS